MSGVLSKFPGALCCAGKIESEKYSKVILEKLEQYSDWETRRTLSQVNHQFREYFKPTCKKLESILVSGEYNFMNCQFHCIIKVQADSETEFRYLFSDRVFSFGVNYADSRPNTFENFRGKNWLRKAQRIFEKFMRNYWFDRMEVGMEEFVNSALQYRGAVVTCLRVPNWASGSAIATRVQPLALIIGSLPAYSRLPLDVPIVDLDQLKRCRHLCIECYTDLNIKQFFKGKLRTLKLEFYDGVIRQNTVQSLRYHLVTDRTELEKVFIRWSPNDLVKYRDDQVANTRGEGYIEITDNTVEMQMEYWKNPKFF